MAIGVRCCIVCLLAVLLSLWAIALPAPAHAAGFKSFGQRPVTAGVVKATAWVQASRPPRSFNV
ncbi:MAG TPA: hypothetical protein VFL55_02990 [Acetobacteraceae bacterium]|nr:hypothetical protein [Acetobacteraceae bacterium]